MLAKSKVEKKRNYKTYFLIAIGTFICLLNKITVGLVIVIAYILMIIFLAIKEKNLKFIFCKQWMATLPIYLIILAYYLIIMNNYGTIHPSLRVIAPEYYKTIRIKSNETNIKLEELELNVIELPKFIFKDRENMTKKEEWIAYFRGCNNRTLEKIKDNNKNIALLDKLIEKYWIEEKME